MKSGMNYNSWKGQLMQLMINKLSWSKKSAKMYCSSFEEEYAMGMAPQEVVEAIGPSIPNNERKENVG